MTIICHCAVCKRLVDDCRPIISDSDAEYIVATCHGKQDTKEFICTRQDSTLVFFQREG
jgi:hypothetical protein